MRTNRQHPGERCGHRLIDRPQGRIADREAIRAFTAHHDYVEHAVGADHAAVEDGEPRGHQQDERCAGEQPRGGGRIDRVQFGLPPDRRRAYVSRLRGVTKPSPRVDPNQLDLMKF